VGLGFKRHGNLGCEARHELAEFDPQVRWIRRASARPASCSNSRFPGCLAEAGHTRVPRVSVSRSIFALMNDLDRAYFGRAGQEKDQIGFIDSGRAVFGRSYAAEPDVLIEQLRKDEAIAEADTLLLTVPNQLGVAYNVHVMEAILTTVAPGLGWRWIGPSNQNGDAIWVCAEDRVRSIPITPASPVVRLLKIPFCWEKKDNLY
jgi:hypothetical protein